MTYRLKTSTPDFATRFDALLGLKREIAADVDVTVRAIVERVRSEGDAAVADLTHRFDKLELAPPRFRVDAAEVDAAVAACSKERIAALTTARDRIAAYHQRQLPRDERFRDNVGAELGHKWTAVDSVGIYVPGGTAAYPSSVLMNAVPAKVAGVPRVAMVVPAPRGELNPLVLAAARLAGVEEIYRIGGAQAVAALAYGTASIPPVAKIVGPGNAYVATAKRLVFGVVGIDMIAGPSEVLVIADKDNDPDWIAADLLAQAEHDTAAQSILITDDASFADAVEARVQRQLADLPRSDIARASWETYGAIIVVGSLADAPDLANRIAAEHVQIATREPDTLAALVRNAGAIFLGAYTPEVIGDYVAGSNHVLPTSRSARFSSGLNVLDFMKRTSILKLDASSLVALAVPAMTLAEAEGLEAHRRSVAVRVGQWSPGRGKPS